MRLISFDVGIKNLAYCVFSNESTNQIVSWKVANLLESEISQVSYTCSQELTKKRKSDAPKLCGKVAKYQSPGPSPLPYTYCCETHAKKSTEWIIPKKDYTLSKLKNKTLPLLQNLCRENGVDVAGLKKQEIVDKLSAYYSAKCFTQVGISLTKTAGETDLISIGRAIKRVLDADLETREATHVIIENQISTIASRMKTIQGMIAQYFIMQSREVHVEFVSSHNKLKGYVLPSREDTPTQDQTQTQDQTPTQDQTQTQDQTINPATNTDKGSLRSPTENIVFEIDGNVNTKEGSQSNLDGGVTRRGGSPSTSSSSSYKANKTDGVAICRKLLDETPTFERWKPDFESSKKKDDLADCFLQGIWWLSKN
jgi:hypothetical protein